VQALLRDRSRQPDLLIEHLHLLQDTYRCLHARHLVALANEMRLALVEVYEVASSTPISTSSWTRASPRRLTVRVCDSLPAR
jgi:formate dehydrogenase